MSIDLPMGAECPGRHPKAVQSGWVASEALCRLQDGGMAREMLQPQR